MKKIITSVFTICLLLTASLLAQEKYWTENWDDNTIEGRLTGTSGEAATVFTDVNQASGTWSCIYAYRGGSNQCDGVGRTLRLFKNDPASRPQGGAAITPPLDRGVGVLTFVEGRGGTNRVILITKSNDNGTTWELVDTLNGTEKCVVNRYEINDANANRVKFENLSTGDVDMDSIEVWTYTAVGVEEEKQLPTAFELNQNYPNPFNPTTTVTYSLPKASDVQIKVYDQIGREVASLLNQQLPAGNHSVVWNAFQSSHSLASGVYFVQLRADSFVKSIKVILLK